MLSALAHAPGGATIASGSWNGEMCLWHAVDGKPVATFLAAPRVLPSGPD
jgi:hypothetical protein